MRVAVTGGSGVVGSALVRHLVAGGHEVRALARSPDSIEKLKGLGAEPIGGDVLDVAKLRSLVDGAEVVYHVAGVNEMCSRAPERMWRVNVDGTRAVMTACRFEGVGRLVHTSSAVTVGEKQGELATEESSHRGFFLSEYERSKHEAERALLNEADGLDVVSVNPSSVQGPGRATGTGRLFLAAARGRLPFVFDTTVSLVDIDDCARGHLLAADRGVNGRRYLLSGATLSMREAIRLLSEEAGKPISPLYLAPRAVRGAAAAAEWVARITRSTPTFCREAARVLLHGHRYDGSRAQRELELSYTPVRDTVRRTLDWFSDEGLLMGRND